MHKNGKSANRNEYQTRKTDVFKHKTRKTDLKNSQNRKHQCPPPKRGKNRGFLFHFLLLTFENRSVFVQDCRKILTLLLQQEGQYNITTVS